MGVSATDGAAAVGCLTGGLMPAFQVADVFMT